MFTKKAKEKRQAEKLLMAQEELQQACSRTSDIQFQTIRHILQQYPDAVKATNNKGDLPLHLACFNGATLQVVELLVSYYPESLKIPDSQGSLAIHWASFGTSPLIVIQNLLLQYPEGISIQTRNGQIPLHYACHGAGRLDVVKVLCEKFPKGLREKNGNGMLPLHIACASPRADIKVVQYLVEQDTSTVFAESNTGQLPLDRAQACGASPMVIQYLEREMDKLQNQSKRSSSIAVPYPTNGVSSKRSLAPPSEEQSTKSIASLTAPAPSPSNIESQFLHACSESTVTVEKLDSLLQQDPDAVMAKTQKGMRPLHICCWKGASVQVVEYLIGKWPESVRSRTARYWIPLHVACASDNKEVQLAVVQCLISHWKDSIRAKDNKERIALHIACFSQASLEVVQYLVAEWPDSVMAMNNYASLPLHLACGTCAALPVIQFLVKSKPESLQAVDSEGRTPLDMAKQPLQHEASSPDTIAWLEHVMQSLENEKKKKEGHFDKERSKLVEVISGEKDKPVAVSFKYVETILQQEEELGKGYFGIVYEGNDTVIKQKFAIKSINRKILVGGDKDDLERIKKAFKKEQRGFLRFRHPNMALLYGYCLSDSQRKGEYLLYELAEKGSLDYFWEGQLGRERLSSFGRRAQIALDTFIGLRFLHVGNKYIEPCFHRDIKSGNIVLKKDMTAQLIDCGLATFAQTDDNTSTMMSTGVKGTRGYVCPKYCTGAIAYDESCDIFSFGVVLCELWTGKQQNHRDANGRIVNYYEQYVNEGRFMEDDLDKSFGFGVGDKIPLVMNEYKHLALDCMARSPKKRPPGEDVMDRLEIIWHSLNSTTSESSIESDEDNVSEEEREETESSSRSDKSSSSSGSSIGDSFLPTEKGVVKKTRDVTESMVEDTKMVGDGYILGRGNTSDPNPAGDGGNDEIHGSTDEIVTAELDKGVEVVEEDPEAVDETVEYIAAQDGTFESSLAASNSNSVDAPTCRLCRTYSADEGCDVCLMCIALQDERDAIAKAVSAELDADSIAVQGLNYPHDVHNEDSSLPSPSIDLRLNNPIPRLFVIVPEALKNGWKHPRTWLRRQVATRYNLFFICGHTYQVIRPPVQLTVSSAWIENIALALGVSLTLLKMAAEKAEELDTRSPDLKLDQLNQMLGEVEKILKEHGQGLHTLECIRSGIRLSDKDIKLLNGETYELIAERSREDRGWRTVMDPARKMGDPHIVWVSSIVVADPESEYEIINV